MSASLRAITAAKSTVTSPVCTPWRAAVRARWATRADARSALVGRHPAVQAGTAHLVGFDQRDPSTGGYEVAGDARAGLTGSDHDRIERDLGGVRGHDRLQVRGCELADASVDRGRLNARMTHAPSCRVRTTVARVRPLNAMLKAPPVLPTEHSSFSHVQRFPVTATSWLVQVIRRRLAGRIDAAEEATFIVDGGPGAACFGVRRPLGVDVAAGATRDLRGERVSTVFVSFHGGSSATSVNNIIGFPDLGTPYAVLHPRPRRRSGCFRRSANCVGSCCRQAASTSTWRMGRRTRSGPPVSCVARARHDVDLQGCVRRQGVVPPVRPDHWL